MRLLMLRLPLLLLLLYLLESSSRLTMMAMWRWIDQGTIEFRQCLCDTTCAGHRKMEAEGRIEGTGLYTRYALKRCELYTQLGFARFVDCLLHLYFGPLYSLRQLSSQSKTFEIHHAS